MSSATNKNKKRFTLQAFFRKIIMILIRILYSPTQNYIIKYLVFCAETGFAIKITILNLIRISNLKPRNKFPTITLKTKL